MARKMHNMTRGGRDPRRPEKRPEQRHSRAEFIWDEKIRERKEQMMEKAEELKAIAPTEAMFAMVGAMDGFSREGNIYKPPTKKDFDDEMFRGSAQRKVREVHEKFDFEDGPKNSDWLRAVGVFKAAMKPGNNIPGVFDVKPPRQGAEDKQWNKFTDWCKENYLDPINLSMVAHRLQNVLGLHGPEDVARLQQRMDDIKGTDMDQVVLAGFINDPSSLRVDYHGTLHRIQDLERDLDPEYQKKEWEERRAFIDAQLAKKFNKIGERWMIRGRHEQYDFENIRDAAERQWDQEHAMAPSPQISNKSAAYEKRMPACIIGLQEKRPPRPGWEHEGPQLYAHGVHPVPMEIVKRFLGEDKIVKQDLGLRFDSLSGEVRHNKNLYLIAENGIPLGSESERATGPEASAVFAQALAKYTRDPSTLRGEAREALPFIDENHYKLGDGLAQLYGRTRGRAGRYSDGFRRSYGEEPRNFDLGIWYQDNLFEAGDISSIAGAERQLSLLTIQYKDLYPDKAEAIAKAERYYPERVEIGRREHELRYAYDQDKDLQQAALLLRNIQAEEFLQWTGEDLPALGPENNPLPITFRFNVRAGNNWQSHNRDFATTDLDFAQEAFYQSEITKAWEQAEGRNWMKKIEIEPGEDWPDAGALVDIDLEPFMTMPNGRELRPVPGIIYGTPQGGEGTGFYVKLFPSKFAAETDSDAYHAREVKESRDRKKAGWEAAGPQKVAQAEALRDGLFKKLEENRKTDIFKIHFAWSVNSIMRDAREKMERGDIDEAIDLYKNAGEYFEEHIEGRMERFQQAQKLYEEYKSLFSGPPILKFPQLDEKRYFYNKETGEDAKEPPSREEVEGIINKLEKAIEEIKAKKAVAAAEKAKDEARKKRWEALAPEERAAEIAELRSQIEETLAYLDEQTNLDRKIKSKFYLDELEYLRKWIFKRNERIYNRIEPDDIEEYYFLLEDLKRDREEVDQAIRKIT